ELIRAGAFTDVLLDALTRLPSDALPEDYRDAILAANLAVRGGADQTAIEAIFTARAFDDTGFPPDFEGFLEDGVPESRFLPDSPPDPNNLNVDFFGFAEFPGSTQVTFQTTGTGDVDLFVAALDPNVVETVFSDNFGSNETIVLNSSTALSVDDDDNWFIAVFDFPDGSGSSYELTATTVLPPSTLSLGGPPTAGSLDDLADVDFYTIETTVPNQVVQVSVAGQGNLDPIVVVLDPRTAEVQEGDDDSGTGTDAFIQGVLLPDPQTWAIAVLALAGDVDDSTAVGSYEITVSNCDNTQGGNFDGDALFDLCDGDTDDDGFGNPVDPNPFDPNLCADLDEDGCDDCTSGSFDPFGDGQDVDADGLCDLGDVDDDNDGCLDTVDPLPLFGSQDSDFDFLGDDCDNCTDVGNADQADFDAGNDDDGSLPGIQHYGDACDTDLDDDGVVGPSDFFGRFRPCLGADLATQPACVEADLDGDGVVAPSDFFSRLRPTFGTAPGPGFTE
ncbi:MAG: hypothetical protein QNK05_13985, partial [Myxococcota bacterium]|nr:hypothetical protein [Myxococcota bacterium]